MRKTYCDRHPETECTYRIGRLALIVEHVTGKGETVATDDYRPAELCGACVDELAALLGLEIGHSWKNTGPGEDAMRAVPAPPALS